MSISAARRAHDGKTFSVGQKDGFVQSAESRLKKLGYDTGKADGVFDRQTAKAMEGFKRDQKDLGKNSMLGEKSGKELARETRRLAHDPTRGRVTKGRTDGKFDERTAGALKAFQQRSGFQPTGRVDERTWAKLNARGVTGPAPKNPKLRLVREIALMAKKYGIPAELPIITALTESNFSKPSGDDRDSVGMFQQRDLWGSYAERHDPIRSAKLFFLGGHGGQRGAVDFKKQFLKAGSSAYGRWAQAVQVSAYPDRYQTRLGEARRLLRRANVKLGTAM
ncbi:MAG: peptidoglycan-binding domain-containing protein [Myxococcaceae bacterium]